MVKANTWNKESNCDGCMEETYITTGNVNNLLFLPTLLKWQCWFLSAFSHALVPFPPHLQVNPQDHTMQPSLWSRNQSDSTHLCSFQSLIASRHRWTFGVRSFVPAKSGVGQHRGGDIRAWTVQQPILFYQKVLASYFCVFQPTLRGRMFAWISTTEGRPSQ